MGVNIAQRAQTEAPPGGLMVSEDLHRQLPTGLANHLKDAGTLRLKNISQPMRLYSWRPPSGSGEESGDITSIALAPIEFAPADPETRAIAGDLHDQLVIRMSRRVGIVVIDAETRPEEGRPTFCAADCGCRAGAGVLA